MKNLVKIALVFVLSVSFFACSNEDTEQVNNEFSSVENVLAKMKAVATEKNKVVKFKITYQDGTYQSEITSLIDPFEYQFEKGYNKQSSGNIIESTNGIKINCSNSNNNYCIEDAIKKCLNNERSATIYLQPKA